MTPRWFLKWWRRRSSEKQETSVNLYMRWEQDNDYGTMNKLGLFEEYLEMGTFITSVLLFITYSYMTCTMYGLFTALMSCSA